MDKDYRSELFEDDNIDEVEPAETLEEAGEEKEYLKVEEEQAEIKHAGLILGIVAAVALALVVVLIVLASINKTDEGGHDVSLAPPSESTESDIVATTETGTDIAATTETVTDKETEDSQETEATTDETGTEEGEKHRYVSGFLDNESYPEIVKLVKDYYSCMNKLDMAGMEKLIMTGSEEATKIDAEAISNSMEIIEEYRNIDCFILKGLEGETYIAYASYDLKFYNVDTLAPSLSRFFIRIQDGKPFIYAGELSAMENAFVNGTQSAGVVTKLAQIIDDELNQAKKSDGKLKFLLTNLG